MGSPLCVSFNLFIFFSRSLSFRHTTDLLGIFREDCTFFMAKREGKSATADAELTHTQQTPWRRRKEKNTNRLISLINETKCGSKAQQREQRRHRKRACQRDVRKIYAPATAVRARHARTHHHHQQHRHCRCNSI